MGVLQEKMGFCQRKHRCATGKRERGVAEEGVAWGSAGPERAHLYTHFIFTTEINLVILVN